MARSVNFTITRGLPFNPGLVRVVDGKNVWAELAAFEVKSQLRTQPAPPSQLVIDLATYMTAVFDGNDIVITWVMTGAQTRQLTRGGYYDVILSDVGSADARALPPILAGKIEVNSTTTDTSGSAG